ncbi:aldehyde dehydrogenase family protein [Sphingobium estronivorans]|uniref:aldehyde dehydrogenase family protein n=1 Tax=Sphingobium estronivorans TaxID=1577690 RepID=UPI001238F98B|nr:aldehyde dehydrogenase family protein [Sphingobium estronivorans]
MVVDSTSGPGPSVSRFLVRDPALWIGGKCVAAESGEDFEVIDPASGRPIAVAARGGAADIDKAVRAARTAFEAAAWRDLSAGSRAQLLWRYADVIEAHAQELAELEVLNNGMPIGFAQWSIAASANWLRHYAGLAGRLAGRHNSAAVSGDGQRFHAYTAPEPVGVVGLITPWNGPIAGFMIKVAPALAAGCTCIVKPAENTPLTALRLAELASQAGIPDGVLNVVTGFGDAGAALVDHPGVDKISFTGSTETGKSVLRAAANHIKRTTLELGGKSPCIVFDDADMDRAIPGAAQAIFANSGQVCFAGSRLYVQRASFDRVVEGVAAIAASLRIGSGLDTGNAVGPMISDRQRQRVVDYIAMGKAEGGEVVAGGRPLDRDGFFIEPTVFTNLASSARIVREEIFGPVVVATPFDDLEEVAALGNDTNYGLGAGIFTSHLAKAHSLAARLRAGNVWVNCYGVTHPAMPFGGFKESGLGREFGEEGFAAFLETKSVFVDLGGL